MQTIEKIFPKIARWIEHYILEVYDHPPLNVVAGEELYFWGNQAVFLSFYLPLQLVDNFTKPYQIKIHDFLNLQARDKIGKNLLEINFFEGLPMDICLLAQSLEDIDMADIFNVTNFGIMNISRHDNKSWTKNEVKNIKKKIKKDLEFDGYSVSIGSNVYTKGSSLELNVHVTDGEINVFRKSFAMQSSKSLLLILAKSKKYKVRSTVAEIPGFELSFYKLLAKDKNINVLLNLVLNLHVLQVMNQNMIKNIVKNISENLKYRCIDKPIRIAHKIETVLSIFDNEKNKDHASYAFMKYPQYFTPIIKRLIYSSVNSPEALASWFEQEHALEYLEYLHEELS